MKKYAPVNVVLHTPTDPQSEEALARKVSEVHASAVFKKIQELPLSKTDKETLLDAMKELAADS